MTALVEVVIDDNRWNAWPIEEIAETAACAALNQLGFGPRDHEVALLASSDSRIAELNAQFRGKAQPTNVLSWPANDLAPEHDGEVPPRPPVGELGDIAMAFETCEREALLAAKPFEAHLRHLIVHAVLHLLGYDHENDADAEIMENLEKEILGNLGDPSPY